MLIGITAPTLCELPLHGHLLQESDVLENCELKCGQPSGNKDKISWYVANTSSLELNTVSSHYGFPLLEIARSARQSPMSSSSGYTEQHLIHDDSRLGSRPVITDFASQSVRSSTARRLPHASIIVRVLRALHVDSYEDLAELSFALLMAEDHGYSESDAQLHDD